MSNFVADKTYALFETSLNKKIIARLKETNADFFLFPALATEPLTMDEEKIELVRNINIFDWLIFTDVTTVDYFTDVLTANGIDFFELDALRLCACGEAVADRLRYVQIHADIIPTDFESAALYANIAAYVGEDHLTDLKFLLIKENMAAFEISTLLRKKNAELTELSVYRALIPDKTLIVRLKTLLSGGAVDEFIFSAPEDLIALKFYFAGASLKNVLAEIKVSALDANIFQNLREHQLSPHYFILK